MTDPQPIPDDELPTDVKNGVLDGDGDVPEPATEPGEDPGDTQHEPVVTE